MDLICITCIENHTVINLEDKEYPAFIGKCIFCDGVKVGMEHISLLREGK